MRQREVERHPATHRAADQISFVDIQELEHAIDIIDRRGWPGGRSGLAEAAMIVAHDAVAVAERADLVVPHAQIGDARMQKDQRMPRARHLIVEFRAVDIGKARGHIPGIRHDFSIPPLYRQQSRVK